MIGSVFSRIGSLEGAATKKEQLFIKKLRNISPRSIMYLSITELSEMTEVAEATIVRFCHKLDYKGYQDFKLHLSQDVALAQDVRTDKSKPDLIADEMIEAIKQTQKAINSVKVYEIADRILASQKICVFALGNSAVSATNIKNRLVKVGLNVYSDTDTHIQLITAANLCEKDIALIISVSGSTKDIIEIAKISRLNKVPVVVITNHMKSPLVQYSDYQLYSAKKEAAYEGGNIAAIVSQCYIVDVMCNAVFERMGDKAKRNLNKSNSAVSNKLL